MTGRWANLWAGSLAVLILWVAFGAAPFVYFLSDDFSLIAEARRGIFVRTETWYFRPTVAAFYRAHDALFGLRPAPYHLSLLAAHLGNVLLVGLVFIYIGLERRTAAAAAVLFAVAHPHHENLYWIAGATEILAAFWTLVSFLLLLIALDMVAEEGHSLHARRLLVPGVAAFLLALGAKPTALLAPFLLFVAWASTHPFSRLRLVAEGSTTVAFLLANIFLAYLTLERKESLTADAGRIAANGVALLAHLVWPFAPAGLVDALRTGTPPPPVGLARGAAVAVAAGAVVAFAAHAARAGPRFRILAAWPFAALVPYLPLSGTNPRYLYLASAGMAGLVAFRLERWAGRRPAAAALALVAVLAASSAYNRARGAHFLAAGEEVRRVLDLFAPHAPDLRAGVPVYVRGLPGIDAHGVWIWAGAPTLRDALHLRYGSTSPVVSTTETSSPARPSLFFDYPSRLDDVPAMSAGSVRPRAWYPAST